MIKTIKKSDGSLVPFNPERPNRWAEWAANFGVNWSEILLDAVKRCYDGCSTADLQNAMIDACVDRQTHAHSLMAGRILAGTVYKEAFGGFRKIPSLKDFYHDMTARNLWIKMNYSDEDLAQIGSMIDHEKDLGYGYAVIKQFRDKYAIRNAKTKRVHESPQFMFMGMAMYVMQNQPVERRMDDIQKLYTYLSDLKINAPTPYLNGLRATNSGYASCCLITANDSARSIGIATSIAYEMTVKQAGIGMNLMTRSIGDGIRQNTISHQGKIPYYRHVRTAVAANKQQSRGGSATVFYPCIDPQIEDLLRLKNPTTVDSKRISEMDYGFQMNQPFIDAVKHDRDWILASRVDAPKLYEFFYRGDAEGVQLFENAMESIKNSNIKHKVVKARELAKLWVVQNFATGRVYPQFVTEANRHTPFKDPILMSNLCMEILLPTFGFDSEMKLHGIDYEKPEDGEVALCFLASLVAGRISDEEYEDVAYYCLLMIDNVMDMMDYPYPSMKKSVQARRSVGVGITNLAHYLAKNYETYSSREGKTLIHELAERHSFWLHKGSLRLAKEKGVAEWMDRTKYPDGWVPTHTQCNAVDTQHDAKLNFDWEALSEEIKANGGIRHSVLEAIAPNESSSLASGTTNSVYPIREGIMFKKSATGSVLFIAPDWEELEYVYQKAWDVPTTDLIDCYAILQKFTGQSISSDLYVDYTRMKVKKVSMTEQLKLLIYRAKMGMKTGYYTNFRVGVGKAALQEAYCEGCGV